MPKGKYLNKEDLTPLLEKKVISEDILNDKVSRILSVMFRLGMFDNKEVKTEDSKALNKEIALQTAKESIVLLKNENILPISSDVKTIAIIGGAANTPRIGGGGSSMVNADNVLSPYKSLVNEFGDKVQFKFARVQCLRGIPIRYLLNFLLLMVSPVYRQSISVIKLFPVILLKLVTEKQINNDWRDNAPYEWLTPDNFSVRWTTELKAPQPGKYTLDFIADDGIKVYIDGKIVVNDWTDHASQNYTSIVDFRENESHKLVFEFYENGGEAIAKLGWRETGTDLTREAIDISKDADLVLLFAGTSYLL